MPLAAAVMVITEKVPLPPSSSSLSSTAPGEKSDRKVSVTGVAPLPTSEKR